MKELFTAFFPVGMFVLGIFLGRLTGRLDGKLDLLDRTRAALMEVKRLRNLIVTGEDLSYVKGYFHGLCHVSEGKPPDHFAVESLLEETE